MQTIVFIGSNKSGTSREALFVSTNMGYYTVLLTNRKSFIRQRKEFSEVQQMIYVEDLLDKNIVLSIIQELQQKNKQIEAVISFIDPFVALAAELSQQLGIVQLSTKALSLIENKSLVRKHITELPVSPKHIIYHIDKPIDEALQQLENSFPLVLKSPVSNGSKDVLPVNSVAELMKGLQYLKKRIPNDVILIEEYLDGPQYLIEVMVVNGEISIIAVIEQEILNGARFIVTGYNYPALLNIDESEKLETAVFKIIRHLQLTNGTCHLEMRNVRGEWKLIEINPRMSGGAMNRIIEEGTGINLVKETIKLFLGLKPNLKKTVMNYVYAKYITIHSLGKLIKITGKNRALKHDEVKMVYVKPRKGAILRKPQSMGDRYAYVIAVADSAEKAKKTANKAAAEIKFYLEPL
ncbi:ATP-grasp domain-containing protein [Neobacillus sp. YIM B02564]|uniref:ATP-grasp domain-containing protein n=1 Tax=Neobacillus paridis TaxID=2803862 RepID=A0ABS1TJY0_9BACI|nr:ATP-grasp domain-containing protein [Neobacillus paridis]MBL4951624.1 ATP-grasp domain-containing protein [Neobacillus paridis]